MKVKGHVNKLAKRFLAILLVLALLTGTAPLVFAEPGETGWIVYYEKRDQNTTAVIVTAPAEYTHVSGNPQIETVFTADPGRKTVSTPEAERIRFCADGKTELRWTLTVTYANLKENDPGYDFRIAVLPGSVSDDAGRGNAYVLFDDETAYMPAGGYAEIDVESGLLLRRYSREDTTVAVGDTLRVDYSGLYPVEILVNGVESAAFPGGEMQSYTKSIAETGTLQVTVRQRGKVVGERTMTVVSSKEMYRRNLRDGLITKEDIPRAADLIQVSGPIIIPFIPAAVTIAFFSALSDFFYRLFSFVRITR